MTYGEHLKWCKGRALEYVAQGDLAHAVASMASDISKHEEGIKQGSPVHTALVGVAMLAVLNNDVEAVRRWINGFN